MRCMCVASMGGAPGRADMPPDTTAGAPADKAGAHQSGPHPYFHPPPGTQVPIYGQAKASSQPPQQVSFPFLPPCLLFRRLCSGADRAWSCSRAACLRIRMTISSGYLRSATRRPRKRSSCLACPPAAQVDARSLACACVHAHIHTHERGGWCSLSPSCTTVPESCVLMQLICMRSHTLHRVHTQLCCLHSSGCRGMLTARSSKSRSAARRNSDHETASARCEDPKT